MSRCDIHTCSSLWSRASSDALFLDLNSWDRGSTFLAVTIHTVYMSRRACGELSQIYISYYQSMSSGLGVYKYTFMSYLLEYLQCNNENLMVPHYHELLYTCTCKHQNVAC